MADREPTRRGRGRRPDGEARADILAAASDLLFDAGPAGFTIEQVARLSGASKVTIYRWWPSKGALALDAYFHRVEPELRFPDTGDIEADLRSQLHAFLYVVRDTPAGAVIAGLIGQAQSDPDLKVAYLQRYSSPRRELAVVAMAGAVERGQLRATVDPQVVVDQLWGACYHRLLLPDEPLDESFVDALVDNLFRGIAG
jgi:AcrR family transcriptional regulator